MRVAVEQPPHALHLFVRHSLRGEPRRHALQGLAGEEQGIQLIAGERNDMDPDARLAIHQPPFEASERLPQRASTDAEIARELRF